MPASTDAVPDGEERDGRVRVVDGGELPVGSVSEEDREAVRRQLRKDPGEFLRVVARNRRGEPAVIEYYPLRREPDGTLHPFPTLWWLTCPDIDRDLAVLENQGWIRRLQSLMREDEAFREAVHADHRRYIEQRWQRLSPAHRELVRERGWERLFLNNGIGGIADWDYVKCLHLHFAHHLADGSTLGAYVAENCLDAAAALEESDGVEGRSAP